MTAPTHPCTKDCPMRSATCHTSSSNCQAWHEYQAQYDKYTEESVAEKVKKNDVCAALYHSTDRLSRQKMLTQKRGRRPCRY